MCPVVGGCVTISPRQLHENRVQHETIAWPAAHAGRHHASPIARSIPSEMLAKRLQIAEARVVARPQRIEPQPCAYDDLDRLAAVYAATTLQLGCSGTRLSLIGVAATGTKPSRPNAAKRAPRSAVPITADA
jgi:hypothetical protein